MTAHLNYYCAARLSNNIGFWGSWNKTDSRWWAFSSQGFWDSSRDFWGLQQCISVYWVLFTAHLTWACKKPILYVFGVNLGLQMNSKNVNSFLFLKIVKHFNPVSVFIQSLFTCGFFLLLFQTLLKYQCFQKNSDHCRSEFVTEITFAYFKVNSKLNRTFIHLVLPRFWWSFWLTFSCTRSRENIFL